MKKGLTELVFIIDSSGSMAGLVEDTIGGFNGLIDKQKAEPGEALVSTVLFNSESRVVHDRVALPAVEPMTRRDYCPMGCTALLDAVGDAIHHIGNVHKYARQEDVPEHTMVVITTDGMENASRRRSLEEVRGMIERQQKKYGWEFIFLGANIDAVATAASIGIRPERAAQYRCDSVGTRTNFEALERAVCCMRASAPIEADWKAAIEKDFSDRK